MSIVQKATRQFPKVDILASTWRVLFCDTITTLNFPRYNICVYYVTLVGLPVTQYVMVEKFPIKR